MTLTTNSLFDKLLPVEEYDLSRQSIVLPDELQYLIDAGFREVDGCILLKAFYEADPTELREDISPNILKDDFDKCTFEDTINDIHIDNYLLDPAGDIDYLKAGLEAGRQLYTKLAQAYPLQFRILISFTYTIYDGEEIQVYGGCVIKFYTIRPSCEDKFSPYPLDQFESDAVAIIE